MDDAEDFDFLRDPKILAVLPPGCEIISVEPHGETNWSVGHRVDVRDGDGVRQFFLKILEREDAAEMALGEYESQVALSKYLPDNVCPALGQGTLESDPSKAFFMTEYHELRPGYVEPALLAELMEKMHSTSVSPNGKFGFPVSTFKGYTPIDNTWCDTWEEYFTRMFRNDIAWEQTVRGADPEFNEVAEEFFSKVVPRLLRPLQMGGRSIQPVLVHGDLWDGNVEFDSETNKPIIFDACCCYGHNEFELSTLNTSRYIMNRDHIEAYTELVGRSEPTEDFDDRLAIYTMRHDIVVAGLWPNWIHLRGVVKQQMLDMIAKYPTGINGFAASTNAQLPEVISTSSLDAEHLPPSTATLSPERVGPTPPDAEDSSLVVAAVLPDTEPPAAASPILPGAEECLRTGINVSLPGAVSCTLPVAEDSREAASAADTVPVLLQEGLSV